MERSRSRSPGPKERTRSRSPRPDAPTAGAVRQDRTKPKPRASKGFRWKDQVGKTSNGNSTASGQDRHSRSDREHQRSDRRDRRNGDEESGRREDRERYETSRRPLDPREDRYGDSDRGAGRRGQRPHDRPQRRDTDDKPNADPAKPITPPSMPAPVRVAAYQEPMIIVNVNDRLGTKAAIPCLASDPIKAFKALVAARIGREPHEIMLKRQGERPFKDQLTLEDYGVSNGVQLDLEVDTGD